MKRTSTILCQVFISVLSAGLFLPGVVSAQKNGTDEAMVKSVLSKRDAGTPLLPQNVDNNWYSQAIAGIQEKEFTIQALEAAGKFGAVNHPQHLGYLFSENGYAVSNFNDDGSVKGIFHENFQLAGMGRQGHTGLSALKHISQMGNREVQYDYADYAITYSNENEGMEQRFLIKNKPAGNRDLQIAIDLQGELEAAMGKGDQLLLYTAGHPADVRMVYDQFKVWDSNKKLLPAHMALTGKHRLTLVVDDRNAVYPVTVDPLNHIANWTNGEGALLGLANTVLYGYSLCGKFDINKDGIADIAIGAPTFVKILTLGATPSFNLALSTGAVFVYLGSASASISTTAAQVLQPSSVAGALFGFSVSSAGDVDKDGFRDLIVGAPGDQVTLTVGLGPLSVAVGKAYIYTGASYTGNPNVIPTPSFSKTLSQTDFGTLTLAPVNPCYGWSVSDAGDVNNDGVGDFMIGCPYYSTVAALPTFSGRVDLFQSTGGAAITGATAAQKIISPTVGSLFGFSLSNANVNGDAFSDLIVGAPGYITSALAGNVYLFYGKSGGITATNPAGASVDIIAPTVGTILFPLPNILSLFGYSVSGAGDINKDGKDDIIIGAPLAKDDSLASTVLAGHAYIYYSGAAGLGGIQTTGFTTLSSPRGPTLLGSVLGNTLFGYSVSGVGDVNVDGNPDVLVGEPGNTALGVGTLLSNLLGALGVSTNTNILSGQAYLFMGTAGGTMGTTPSWTLKETGTLSVANLLGASTAALGDINNDGIADFIVGAPSGVLNIGASLAVTPASLGTALNVTLPGNVAGAYAYLGSPTILPLTLVSFSGSAVEAGVLLDWSTSMEENTSHFEIEHSTDNATFTTIGQVAAQGNSHLQTNYSFTDVSPAAGANYYRLKMVDLDGNFTYSRIVVINLSANGPSVLAAWPNPAHGSFSLVFKNMQAGTYRMSLINAIGQQLMTKDILVGSSINYSEVIPLNTGMAQGTYYIKVVDEKHNSFVSKVVVE